MCFTAGSLWYKYSIHQASNILHNTSAIPVGEGNATLNLIKVIARI